MAGVVLVHGAWHGAWCWALVVEELQRREVAVDAIDLPLTGFPDDVEAARTAIGEMGPDTVLVGHSYGGMVISEAGSGASTVRRLVYVAALMADAGEDATAILAGSKSPLLDVLVFSPTGVSVDPDAARGVFYGDSDEQSAAALVSRLRPMPLEAMTQVAEPAWKSIPSTYVVCTHDRALPPEAQRTMASRADEIVEVDSDHSPFVTRAAVLADLLVSHLT